MARVQAQAAGGIVLRRELPARVAVVRLRKRDEWVLPKGKLDPGETPRAAARREVLEETGHHVTVCEFLGTLVYDAGGRPKIVHYWSMEAGDEQTRELMSDIRAVDWLPLNAAIERLSRDHERAFLEAVGPLAISAHARRLKARAIVEKEQAAVESVARKDRGTAVVPEAAPIVPSSSEPMPQLTQRGQFSQTNAAGEVAAIEPLTAFDAARMGVEPGGDTDGRPRGFAQRVLRWLGRTS